MPILIDNTSDVPIFFQQGGAVLEVKSGGSIQLDPGATITFSGTNCAPGILSLVVRTGGTPVGALAAAGTTQGTAAALTADLAIVSGANGTAGVILPAASVPGLEVTVVNTAAAVLKVYPNAGGAINALAANAAYSMAANTSTTFSAQSATQWWTTPATAS